MTKEEAIKELSYIADEMPSMECRDWKKAIYIAIEALEQKPKTGKWIYDTGRFGNDMYDDAWYHIYRCSECGRTVTIDSQKYLQVTEEYPYCRCGAKMVESESEN